ncbi:MAG: hypothetical protein ACLUFN_00730 [Eubacterium sp.]
MKKLLSVLICISIIVCIFAACSDNKDNEQTSTTATTGITTDSAKITESDAISLIKSYSDKELGITAEEREKCSFMVSGSGTEIDKDFYIKVIAAVKTAHEEGDETTYTFDNKGEYYIRYDGKQILSMDMKTGKYSEMKVKDVPTTEATTAHTTEKAE